MLIKTDLQAIAGLITSGLTAEREHTKGLLEAEREHTKNFIEANNRILGTIIKVELAETNKRIDNLAKETKELKKGQERLEEKLDEKAEERFKQLEDRIQALEEQLRNVKVIRS